MTTHALHDLLSSDSRIDRKKQSSFKENAHCWTDVGKDAQAYYNTKNNSVLCRVARNISGNVEMMTIFFFSVLFFTVRYYLLLAGIFTVCTVVRNQLHIN